VQHSLLQQQQQKMLAVITTWFLPEAMLVHCVETETEWDTVTAGCERKTIVL
jgi:hypothetical protein